jgi:thiosulfate dehydrogenase
LRRRRLPAANLGARLVADSRLSTSPTNGFSWATCHPVRVGNDPPGALGPLLPGANLFDSVYRPSWWGGYQIALLYAINYCLVEFMGGAPLSTDAPPARQLYDYLATVSPDDPAPAQPLTVVKLITDLGELRTSSDADRGAGVYQRTCRGCHGAPHTGSGRLGGKTSIVPEDTISGPVCGPGASSAPPGGDPLACARTVVVEKIRHGKFFNIGGSMPLYSREANW